MFLLQYHSKRFDLYCDILCLGLVGAGSSGDAKSTEIIFQRERTVIPIPDEIAQDFLPEANERKRLEVRSDILYLSAM